MPSALLSRLRSRLRSRHVLAVVVTAVAALLWWPAGFWGLDDWPGAPLRALDGDVVALSATAAAVVVAALVRDPWPRLAVVAGCSALAWWTSAPAVDTAPDERQVLLLLLLASGVLGVLVGRHAQRGPVACAAVLVVVAALTQATWPTGAALAVALALPFAVATWQRVAPTLWSVAGLLGLWLASSMAALALRSGWDVLHPGMSAGSKRAELRLVLETSWDFLRTEWRDTAAGLLGSYVGWFWVAAALAALVVAARVVGVPRRGAATSSGRTGRPDDRVTSGGPRR